MKEICDLIYIRLHKFDDHLWDHYKDQVYMGVGEKVTVTNKTSRLANRLFEIMCNDLNLKTK